MSRGLPRKLLALVGASAVAVSLAAPMAYAQPIADTSRPLVNDTLADILQSQAAHPSPDSRVKVLVLLKEQPRVPAESTEKALLAQQDELLEKWKTEFDLRIDRQFGYLLNGFSAEMPVDKMRELAAQSEVKSVRRERVYYKTEKHARDGHGVKQAFKQFGTDGAGTVISIIDSGVDPRHKAMRLDDSAKDKVKIKAINSNPLGHFTLKVPQGYNYADNNFEVMDTTSSQHGQHVAGIAAANGSEGADAADTTHGSIDGVAPNAQILAMKVFSNVPGAARGADDNDIIAAIEDSVKLGADVINMSLGSPNGFQDASEGAFEAMKIARDHGIITVVAAGNDGMNFSTSGGPDDILGRFDDGTVGTPATQESAFAVASLDNTVVTTPKAYLGGG